MLKKFAIYSLMLVVFFGLGFIYVGCNTGVEVSPKPGILRVTLQSDPADTFIVIISDTFTVSEDDWFGVTIFQGRVYNGDYFALLFKDTKSYLVEDVTYNILERENGEYNIFTIFESYVAPGNYDKLQFGVTADLLVLGYFGIPVKLPEGANLLVDLFQDFHVDENRTTEINIQISPFKSVNRYRDSYHFTREMRIIGVNYY